MRMQTECQRTVSASRPSQARMMNLLNLNRLGGFRAVPHLARVFQAQRASEAAVAGRGLRVLASKGDQPRAVDAKSAALDGVKTFSSDISASKIAIPYADLTVGE